VFIGGGITTDGLFEQCWSALRPHGRLVANAVTLEAEQILTTLYRQYARENGGELLRIAVSHAASLGTFHGMRPAMPVTQLTLTKPSAGDSVQGEAR
jgi:precorrin-6Y C5,15-methyltransferase (decarboxylating)